MSLRRFFNSKTPKKMLKVMGQKFESSFYKPPGEQIYAHLQGYSIEALVNKRLKMI